MSAETELFDAYQEWRQLSEAEGEAIRHGDWRRVNECQNALQALQPRIIRFTDEANAEWNRQGADRSAKEIRLRAVVKELIELEGRNSALLRSLRRSTRAQLDEMDQVSHNLRRIQRSYVPARAAAWSSFS